MKVLVDTSVWSLALRRRAELDHPAVRELRSLIDEGRVAMIGPIRQELLSGIRIAASFEQLRNQLQAFTDEPLGTTDYERAAAHFNACRARVVPGSNTDFLICAIAERRDLPILTTDGDFVRFAKVLPISLHRPPPPATLRTLGSRST
jgi:predicted nucleic acid-binding protein